MFFVSSLTTDRKDPNEIVIGTDTKGIYKFNLSTKKAINLDPNSPIIGYVGRIGYEKNLHTLFEAYKRLKREFANLTLLIVGDGVKEIKKELSTDDSGSIWTRTAMR